MSADSLLQSVIGLTTLSLLSLLVVMAIIAKDVAHFEQEANADLELFKKWYDSAWSTMSEDSEMQSRNRRNAHSRRFVDDQIVIDSEVDLNVRDVESLPFRTSTLPPSLRPFGSAVDGSTVSVRQSDAPTCNCAARANQCPPGPAGPPGESGKNGDDAPPGNDGSPGANGITVLITRNNNGCIKCPHGKPGPPGKDGEAGIPGPQGPSGDDAVNGLYMRQGPPGPPGNVGISGSSGRDGAPGLPGAPATRYVASRGPPGSIGAVGPVGLAGAPGFAEPGQPGPAGDAGQPGRPGHPGPDGIPGAGGRPGSPGTDAAYCPCPPHIGQYLPPREIVSSSVAEFAHESAFEGERATRMVDGELKRQSSRTGSQMQMSNIRGWTAFGDNSDTNTGVDVRSAGVILPYNPLTRAQRQVIAQHLSKNRQSRRI